MNNDAFKSWLDGYGRAWEARDPKAAADLFTEGATYQETPFIEPVRGRPAIQEYWREATQSQDQVRFGYEILSVTEDLGIARWWVSLNTTPTQTPFKMDGIFVVLMADGNRCQEFREWWHGQAG